jgi:hypothetical protein
VDSGNLAGHLLVLRQGLLAAADFPLVSDRMAAGRADAFAVFEEVIGKPGVKRSPEFNTLAGLLRKQLAEKPAGLKAHGEQLKRLEARCQELGALLGALPEAAWWLHALELQIRDLAEELAFMAPWLACPDPGDDFWETTGSPEERPVMAGLRALWQKLLAAPTLREVANLEAVILPFWKRLTFANYLPERKVWLEQFNAMALEAGDRGRERLSALDKLARQCQSAADMEYDFLYDSARHLLAIGYHVSERRREDSFYDLLASEARLGSFVAIAQGCLPQENWFSLGRSLTMAGGRPVLLSWGGSMFEYLMPLLVMPFWAKRARPWWPGKLITAKNARCSGGFPNPATMPRTQITFTSTGHLAYRAWALNGGSPTIWSLHLTPRPWP